MAAIFKDGRHQILPYTLTTFEVTPIKSPLEANKPHCMTQLLLHHLKFHHSCNCCKIKLILLAAFKHVMDKVRMKIRFEIKDLHISLLRISLPTHQHRRFNISGQRNFGDDKFVTMLGGLIQKLLHSDQLITSK